MQFAIASSIIFSFLQNFRSTKNLLTKRKHKSLRSMKVFNLLALSTLMLLEAYRFTDETDRQALLEFKSQVSEGRRDVLSSWNNSFPLCRWKGVRCGRKHKRVTLMDLNGLQLGGVISPSIGNLSFLISLNLSDNSFGGTIPREVGNLFRLEHLDMSFNFLKEGIPISLYNCSRLAEFYLFSNHLGGGVPSEIGSLTKLVELDLGQNDLKGKLPASLGNLTSLMEVSFTTNNIEGEIPNDIGRLTQIVALQLSANKFSGVFPPSIYNLSTLLFLNIFGCGFSGSLRPDFGNLLPNLEHIYMGGNYFTGAIPITLPIISNLQVLGMEDNNLRGSIPPSFGQVPNLQSLNFRANQLGSRSFGDLDFLGALTNCSQLQVVDVGENWLGGDLPNSIANLSRNLMYLSLQTNFISGSIPHDIGNLISLQSLRLNQNLGNITRLVYLYFSNNSFDGTIPPSLGKCSQLLDLRVGYNKLNGTIPQEIMVIRSLTTLSMSNNYLSGSLAKDVGRLQNLVRLSVAANKLSGELPQTLGNCFSMEFMYLQGNSFDGAIPDIRKLVGVKEVDLSNNNLSGSIPVYIANFSSLQYLNLSINNFEGMVPTEGKFQNSTIVLLFGNKNLCGGIKELKLKPCIAVAPLMETKHLSLLKKVVIGVSVGIAFLLLLFIVSLRWFIKRKKNQKTNNSAASTLESFHEKISYGVLRNATDGFSSSNMVGSGSFGTVFKALLRTENKLVAVKVLNMQRRGAMKSFMAECESLKDIRHRNLVELLTACASIDFQGNEFRALIYEFMPNGSLDMWLHPEEVEEIRRPSRTLTLLERLNIAIDVASVLDYLHVHCHEPIAHCDLKPSNTLLDDDLTAHVSDFGLARLLLKFDQESFFNQLSSAGVRGTIGYAAPEYGMGGQPSIHGDVYSFGVLLLEMFTGKRPTNELFGDNFTLHSYTKSALPERVLDITDKSILHNGLRVGFRIAECLTLVLEVGLRCCEESPTNRLATSEVAKELISIRERFFKTRRTARR
ncbi:probable LRR receptor-like serine/threonine-protein kinase At3g47570 [Arabidopsis lyrata subsp. lyrata]|nr:probable LRR receptor-like serine/threonine-protein kinase At3g47570 [Arabidopsis lyrata subsp. lyrata]|eukprot:XP_002875849.2 probable LRR receptor-like serine/threonine-protein kinase At3g47570 [Arabidopsis lyrata subsp. lyrata]